jgi:hypothetical protein
LQLKGKFKCFPPGKTLTIIEDSKILGKMEIMIRFPFVALNTSSISFFGLLLRESLGGYARDFSSLRLAFGA